MQHRDLIRFVPAGRDKEERSSKKTVSNSLTGEEAKSFYEDIIGIPTEAKRSADADRSQQNGKQKCACHRKHRCGSWSSYRSCLRCTDVIKQETDTSQSFAIQEPDTGQIFVKLEPGDSQLFERREPEAGQSSVKQELDAGQIFREFNSAIGKPDDNRSDIDFQRRHFKLLNFAQNGNLSDIEKLFRLELIDVDFQDKFGWTALMCAAVSRHIPVIQFLLTQGANRFILNNKGQNVLDLCEAVGAIDAKIVINTFRKLSTTVESQQEKMAFFCSVCKMEFQECTQNEHASSTVHLFNLRLKPKSDGYLIPESNRGFQLMRKSGWDGETGLGPEGEGHKYPVKTKLKRDRMCLGMGDKTKAKITHFGPKDTSAVKSVHTRGERVMSARTCSKIERKKREKRDKMWERNLRTYMNSDF